jgi:hypothetical protein
MLRTIIAGLLALAGPALAQDDGLFLFGGDAFGSGATVTMAQPGIADVFGAGERVEIAAPIAGSAHLAGRRVTAGAEIGGSLVAFGADVTVAAPVAGSVTVAGYDVGIAARVGGNLRAAGRSVSVTAPIAGSALLSAGALTLDGAIGGDAAMNAGSVVFGPEATVGGKLVLYGREAATLAVPDRVAPPERIERQPGEGGAHRGPATAEIAGPAGWMALATGFAIGVAVLAVLAFLVALLAPRRAEGVAAQLATEPVWTVWIGFLTLSAMLGACVVAVLTIVGVLAVPLILLASAVVCFLGYLFGVYVLGRAVWTRFDRLPPDGIGERALTALIGALVVSLLGLVPFVGWPLLLLLTLAGLGALSIALFRPEFGR